jgi:hypothetical protein
MSGDADKLLLWGLQPQLKQLLLMKQAYRPDQCLANVVTQHVTGAPASWLLSVRDIQPVSSMNLDWEVEVAAIKRALRDSVDQQKVINVWSPAKCLLSGVRWGMHLQCNWNVSKQGSIIRLYTQPKNLPAGAICRCTFSLECIGVQDAIRTITSTQLFKTGCTSSTTCASSWSTPDFFKLGCMSGGFNEAAWAAKGLPASGSIKLRLTVKDVGVQQMQ